MVDSDFMDEVKKIEEAPFWHLLFFPRIFHKGTYFKNYD